MTENELLEEITNDLFEQIKDEPTSNEAVLKSKVKNAIREVKRARRYPLDYTEEQIQADLYGYYSNICNIALYDYNKTGAEGEQSHTENGVSRTYKDRDKLFRGIVPFASF